MCFDSWLTLITSIHDIHDEQRSWTFEDGSDKMDACIISSRVCKEDQSVDEWDTEVRRALEGCRSGVRVKDHPTHFRSGITHENINE